ncbi:hypothetical protein VIGAN_09043300 [Vigna angularis var. angularis]|uniref:Pentatricopeptide repeat-containing protein n=1 Tax=Vigna angularis var. angularis TaxID=157739 RepID=A0A0S3SW62_PHAAN|nr:hypothetical protein VIGAN_09043300 [Vigna angularis var. angularis]
MESVTTLDVSRLDGSVPQKEWRMKGNAREIYGNVMISGYVAKGKLLEALSLFREMRKSYVELNAIICTSVLAACS